MKPHTCASTLIPSRSLSAGSAYANTITITPNLQWSYTVTPTTLDAQLSYTGGDGWVGLGVSRNGGMVGSVAGQRTVP